MGGVAIRPLAVTNAVPPNLRSTDQARRYGSKERGHRLAGGEDQARARVSSVILTIEGLARAGDAEQHRGAVAGRLIGAVGTTRMPPYNLGERSGRYGVDSLPSLNSGLPEAISAGSASPVAVAPPFEVLAASSMPISRPETALRPLATRSVAVALSPSLFGPIGDGAGERHRADVQGRQRAPRRCRTTLRSRTDQRYSETAGRRTSPASWSGTSAEPSPSRQGSPRASTAQ